MTTDRKSNVIASLIERASSLEEQRNIINKKKHKKKMNKGYSLSSISSENKCFSNTLELVLSGRR